MDYHYQPDLKDDNGLSDSCADPALPTGSHFTYPSLEFRYIPEIPQGVGWERWSGPGNPRRRDIERRGLKGGEGQSSNLTMHVNLNINLTIKLPKLSG